MAILKSMIMLDPLQHEIPVEYHYIKTAVVNVDDMETLIVLASYHAKGQKDWQVESYVKPPMTIIMNGIDKTILEMEEFIVSLPEWKDAIVVQ